MKRLAGIFIGGLALCVAVLADTVFTRDGTIHRGKISLGTNHTVRVVSPAATNVVAATNLLRAVFGATASKPGISHVTFKLYQGNWKTIPDFTDLPIAQNGSLITNRLDLTPLGADGGAQRLFDLQPNALLERWASPRVRGRPFSVHATIKATAGEGVILAHGGHLDGYVLYLQGGHANFGLRVNRKLTVVRSAQPVPLNKPVKIMAQVRRDATLEISVDDAEPATFASPSLMIRQPLDGLSVGRDAGVPVGGYKGENRLQGTTTEARVMLTGMALLYTGNLQVTTPGPYQFSLAADEATQLTIDGRVVIDNSDPANPTVPWGTADLAAGSHEFQLTYAQLLPAKGKTPANAAPRVVGQMDKVWFEDRLPDGVTEKHGAHEWVSAPAPVHSGEKSLKISTPNKEGSFYFHSGVNNPNKIQPLVPAENDHFYAYVYLDPKNPPRQIVMQWHDHRGWEHRAYWGANLHNPGAGAHGTVRLRPMGPLPAPGKWARLEVPIMAVGFAPGSPWPTIHGWGFVVNRGTAYFDQCGLAKPILVQPRDAKHLSLNWFGPGAINHALSAVPHPSAKTWRIHDKAVPAAGYLTWDGSYFPKKITKIDAEKVHLGSTSLAREDVSTVILRPLSFLQTNRLNKDTPGVLLMNGDLIEGSLRSMNEKEIVISSVLLGLKTFKPFEEAVAIILKEPAKPTVRHHFKLRDGSLMFAKQFETKGAQIILGDALFKGRTIPFSQIAEMTYGRVPNLLQGSVDHLAGLSESGRQKLEDIDKGQLLVVQQYGEWLANLAKTDQAMADDKQALPPLAKAETDAQATQAKTLATLNTAKASVTTATSAHNTARSALTTTRSKLDADCAKLNTADQALAALIASRQDTPRQAHVLIQRQATTIAASQAFNHRDLAAAQAAITHATLAQATADTAAKATTAAITAHKTKLTAATTALTAARNDFAAKQKLAATALTTQTNSLTTKLQPALNALVTANLTHTQSRQAQAGAQAKLTQLNRDLQAAIQLSQKTTATATTATKSLTTAQAQAKAALTAATTATNNFSTATNNAATARKALRTHQDTLLNPAIAKAETDAQALTSRTRQKTNADQVLLNIQTTLTQAKKITTDTTNLSKTPFDPAQLPKDLAATQAIAAQLKALQPALQAPIDQITANSLKPLQASLTTQTNTLAKAAADIKTAEAALATLKQNITDATTAHTVANKAATDAETKAKTALTAHTTATNALVTTRKNFATQTNTTATARAALAEKHLARQKASQAAAAATATLLQAQAGQTRATKAAAIAKQHLATATPEDKAALAADKTAATTLTAAKTQVTTANSALTKAQSTWNTKKTALRNAHNTLKPLAQKHATAAAALAKTQAGWLRANQNHIAATRLDTQAKTKNEADSAALAQLEQTAKTTKDKDELAKLNTQITTAKTALSRHTNGQQRQAAAKLTAATAALAKSKTAKDTAQKNLTTLSPQVTAATLAVRKAQAEFTTAAAEVTLSRRQHTATQARQLVLTTNAATAKDRATLAKQALTTNTAADTAAKAKLTAAANAVKSAQPARDTAAKALLTASQQVTAADLAVRNALKAQEDSRAKMEMAAEKEKQAAMALADARKFAGEQRAIADKAKTTLDDLAMTQQKQLMDDLAKKKTAATKAQVELTTGNAKLKATETELAMLKQAVQKLEPALAETATLGKTLQAKPETAAKLAAEKKKLLTAVQMAEMALVNGHQKWATTKATAAKTALATAKTNKTSADKALQTIKTKAAELTTAFQKSEQAALTAEAAMKKAAVAHATASETEAMAAKTAAETMKQAETAKADLTKFTTDQKLATTAAASAKTALTNATTNHSKVRGTHGTTHKEFIAAILARRMADQAEAESAAKLQLAEANFLKMDRTRRILELREAAWKDRSARLAGELSRLAALRHSPATSKASSLGSAFTSAVTRRAASDKAVTAGNLAVATAELDRRKLIETGLTSDTAELKAQETEATAWQTLVEAKTAAAQAQVEYTNAMADYRAKKTAADKMRAAIAKGTRDSATAKAELTRLKTAYEAIIRP